MQKQIIRERPGAGPAGDRRDPGARIDAGRAASDARGSQRRGQCGGRGGRRDHAGRGNRRRRCTRSRRCRRSPAIIEDAESHPAERSVLSPTRSSPAGTATAALCARRRVTLATAGDADAIVAVTREGKTAWLLSAPAPARADLRRDRERSGRPGCSPLYVGRGPSSSPTERDTSARAQLLRRRAHSAGRVGRRIHQREPRAGRLDVQLPQRPADRSDSENSGHAVDSDGVGLLGVLFECGHRM